MRTYERPEIVDHGTLVDLTQSFALDYGMAVAKLVTIAAVSVPFGIQPPGPGPADVDLPVPVPGDVLPTDGAPDGGGVLGDGGASPQPGQDGPQAPGREVGPGEPRGGSPPGAGETRNTADSGVGGGRLAFTGSWPLVTAAFGAMLASSGMAIRTRLRRQG